MKPAIPMALLLIACGAAAQDVEPTADRAIRAIVAELVSELPWRMPNADALAIRPGPSADDKVVEAFTAALIRAGFTVRAGDSAGGVPLTVSTRRAGTLEELQVVAGDLTVARQYGRAGWIDRPAGREKVLVIGASSPTIEGTIESARAYLRQKLNATYPDLWREKPGVIERAVLREPASRFIAKRTSGGRQLYEAYVLAEPGFDRLERAQRSVHRQARAMVWIRSGAVAATGLVLWLLYLRADFRTRGWRTTRLRVLFGTLFVAISATLLWNFPQ
jgi:hypothetical protein